MELLKWVQGNKWELMIRDIHSNNTNKVMAISIHKKRTVETNLIHNSNTAKINIHHLSILLSKVVMLVGILKGSTLIYWQRDSVPGFCVAVA
jgi:hypothetical protein